MVLGLHGVNNVLPLSAKVKHVSYLENRSDRWLQLKGIRAGLEKTSLWRGASSQRWKRRVCGEVHLLSGGKDESVERCISQRWKRRVCGEVHLLSGGKDESVERCIFSAVEPETLAQLRLSYKKQVIASKKFLLFNP